MPRADRAFSLVLAIAAIATSILLLPLVLTVVPGAVQRAVHGLGGAIALCAGALIDVHEELPPLGVAVLALTAAAFVVGLDRVVRILMRTARVGRTRVEVGAPARLRRVAARLGILRAVVCCADPNPYAYCAGFLRPRIYVSTGAVVALRECELEAVLLHERHHRSRRDPLRVLVGRAVAAALFAVPLVAELERRFELAKELDADRETVRAQGGRPEALAGALLALGDLIAPFRTAEVATSAWSVTSVRIDHLTGSEVAHVPGPSRRVVVASLATLVLAAALGLGQAARTHLLPAGVLPERAPGAHQCPVPYEGPLL